MDSHTIAYERFYAATQAIRDHAAQEIEWQEPDTPVCGTCLRPWHQVEGQGHAVSYRYASNMAPKWQCATCATARIGSYQAFGIERRAGASGATVPGKLNMMMGTSIIITANNILHFAPPAAFAERFKNGLYAQKGQMHSRQGQYPLLLLLSKLWESGELGEPEKGFVCIGGFNRKIEPVMSGLRASTSLHEVWVFDHTGVQVVDFAGLIALRDRLRELGLVEKACRSSFWKPINDATRGRRDEAALRKWMDKTPGARELLGLLPQDPHARVSIHKQIKDMEGL